MKVWAQSLILLTSLFFAQLANADSGACAGQLQFGLASFFTAEGDFASKYEAAYGKIIDLLVTENIVTQDMLRHAIESRSYGPQGLGIAEPTDIIAQKAKAGLDALQAFASSNGVGTEEIADRVLRERAKIVKTTIVAKETALKNTKGSFVDWSKAVKKVQYKTSDGIIVDYVKLSDAHTVDDETVTILDLYTKKTISQFSYNVTPKKSPYIPIIWPGSAFKVADGFAPVCVNKGKLYGGTEVSIVDLRLKNPKPVRILAGETLFSPNGESDKTILAFASSDNKALYLFYSTSPSQKELQKVLRLDRLTGETRAVPYSNFKKIMKKNPRELHFHATQSSRGYLFHEPDDGIRPFGYFEIDSATDKIVNGRVGPTKTKQYVQALFDDPKDGYLLSIDEGILDVYQSKKLSHMQTLNINTLVFGNSDEAPAEGFEALSLLLSPDGQYMILHAKNHDQEAEVIAQFKVDRDGDGLAFTPIDTKSVNDVHIIGIKNGDTLVYAKGEEESPTIYEAPLSVKWE